jgi:mRNA interferase RelE/StbE
VAGYKVLLKRSAAKEIAALPTRDWRRRVVERIGALAAEPRLVGNQKLAGSDDTYRIRVGDYRILYEVDDDRREVTIFRIAHRKEAYR